MSDLQAGRIASGVVVGVDVARITLNKCVQATRQTRVAETPHVHERVICAVVIAPER